MNSSPLIIHCFFVSIFLWQVEKHVERLLNSFLRNFSIELIVISREFGWIKNKRRDFIAISLRSCCVCSVSVLNSFFNHRSISFQLASSIVFYFLVFKGQLVIPIRKVIMRGFSFCVDIPHVSLCNIIRTCLQTMSLNFSRFFN
jgi:hypothetical protein